MAKWQYLVAAYSHVPAMQQSLDQLGADGWELVSLNYVTGPFEMPSGPPVQPGEKEWVAVLKKPGRAIYLQNPDG